MEGAASAANSRNTSHAASRAHSPDLPFLEHAHNHSPKGSLQHDSHLQSPSSSELHVGHANPVQQQLPATAHAADGDPAASQPSSSHSSPAVSRQQPVQERKSPSVTEGALSPSVTEGAAAQASPVSVGTTVATLLSPEASAAESEQTDHALVQESPDSPAWASKQPQDDEEAIKESSNSASDMLRQSGSLGHSERKHKMSPDIQQMQPAVSMAGPELAAHPHEASEAHVPPQTSALRHSASLPSNGSQTSSGSERNLQAETAPQALANLEASCKLHSAASSAHSVSGTSAELQTDSVSNPAAPAAVIGQSGSSPASSTSSCRHSLDGNTVPAGGHGSVAMLLGSQAAVNASLAAEDSRSTSPSSSVITVEAEDAVPALAPAGLCLSPDARQVEAASLQHAVDHTVQLDSPLSQMHASHSAASQSASSHSGSSIEVVPDQTEQSRTGQMGTSPTGGGSASSQVGSPAAGQQNQQETHSSAGLQVCKTKEVSKLLGVTLKQSCSEAAWVVCIQDQPEMRVKLYRALQVCFVHRCPCCEISVYR